MALRLSFAAAAVPILLGACGNSAGAPAGLAGASAGGVNSAAAGSGGATSSSGGTGGSAAGASATVGGGATVASSAGRGGSLASESAHGGASEAANFGGNATGGAAGSTSTAGTGGLAGGYPSNWIVFEGVDYSMIPGPNFDTVRLMFQGVPCSGSSCHFGGRNHLQVSKTPDELYKYMIGFKTLDCGKLIDTANPSQSALVKYLRGPCGAIERMPSFKCFEDGDEACVPEYYIQAIEQWIALGAPR